MNSAEQCGRHTSLLGGQSLLHMYIASALKLQTLLQEWSLEWYVNSTKPCRGNVQPDAKQAFKGKSQSLLFPIHAHAELRVQSFNFISARFKQAPQLVECRRDNRRCGERKRYTGWSRGSCEPANLPCQADWRFCA